MKPDRRQNCQRSAAALVAVLLLPGACSAAEEEPAGPTLAEAFGELREEQTTAESYLTLLHLLKSDDMSIMAQGIRDYGKARASFAGLIEQLKVALLHDKEPPASAEKFQLTLHTAVTQRALFTDRVDEIIDAMGEDGKRGSVAAATAVVAVLPILANAAKTIWDEYRRIGEERRKDLVDELESLRWKPVNELIDFGG